MDKCLVDKFKLVHSRQSSVGLARHYSFQCPLYKGSSPIVLVLEHSDASTFFGRRAAQHTHFINRHRPRLVIARHRRRHLQRSPNSVERSMVLFRRQARVAYSVVHWSNIVGLVTLSETLYARRRHKESVVDAFYTLLGRRIRYGLKGK